MSANLLFWLLLATWMVAFVVWLAAVPHVDADEPALPDVVHPCALRGHSYRAQPVVWRCPTCGDVRCATDVYDQARTSALDN